LTTERTFSIRKKANFQKNLEPAYRLLYYMEALGEKFVINALTGTKLSTTLLSHLGQNLSQNCYSSALLILQLYVKTIKFSTKQMKIDPVGSL